MSLGEDSSCDGQDQAEPKQKPLLSRLRSDSRRKEPNISRRTMEDSSAGMVVEALLREISDKRGSLIEVKWKGWPHGDNTWKLRSELLEDFPEMVTEFDSRMRADAAKLGEGACSTMKTEESMMSAQTSSNGDVIMADLDETKEQETDLSPTKWKGWAELENDPLIFSTLLREWGVNGVGVREVIPLDAIYDTPVESTLGLIFLSRWMAFDQGTGAVVPSEKLWFANQISSFSCATVALMNIINNRTDIDIGDELQRFKDSTQNLSPKDRGLALDDFESVRDVHNSFATENDRLHVDARLRDDVRTANAEKRAQNRPKGGKGRRGRKGQKKKATKKQKGTDADGESGLHFVAFVPALGQLWRLDGLERAPTSVGVIEEEANWLGMVVPLLEAQFSVAEAMNEMEFSLLSVVLTGSDHVDEQAEERMRRVREDWGPMMATLVRIHAEKGDLAAKLGEAK